MSYREARAGELANTDQVTQLAKAILVRQAAGVVEDAANRRASEAVYAERLGNGQCTPVTEVYEAGDVAEMHAFRDDMAAARFPRSVVFAPKPATVQATPKRRLSILSSRDIGQAAAPQGETWTPRQGYVIGTFKNPEIHWTGPEAAPVLAVLLVDQEEMSIGAVPSVVTPTGRIVPNTQAKPQPLRPEMDGTYLQPTHGAYMSVIPNILSGIVESPEGRLAGPLPGSLFLDSTLTDVLLGISRNETPSFSDLTPQDLLPPQEAIYGMVLSSSETVYPNGDRALVVPNPRAGA